MSLAQVLTGKAVDESLDSIFKSSAGPSTIATTRKSQQTTSAPQKRKPENLIEASTPKKSRTSEEDGAEKLRGKKTFRQKDEQKAQSDEEDAEENESDVASSNEDEAVPEHESVKNSNRRKKKDTKKMKYVPDGETREQRDARTIFIGNLPVAVVNSKTLTKQLKRHVLSHVPSAKIESVRFRSVAFRNPTSTLEEEDDEKKALKQNRQQKRAADWRAQNSDADDRISKRDQKEAAEDKKGEKSYMTPAEKRRLAAIKGELHENDSATANAYVVFAHPLPIPPGIQETRVLRKEVMDPFEAARVAVRKLNGTIFAEHMMRVDHAGKPTQTAENPTTTTATMTDPRSSIFVGNLDFASSEDDVRAFFEKVVCEERGKPAADTNGKEDEDEDEDEDVRTTSLNPSWVTRVRIVRDRETQLGKGFAYVQFSDRDCVDEVLSLNEDKLKFAKRTLRVQRCKTLPALAAKSKLAHPSTKVVPLPAVAKLRSQMASPAPLPKGDPTLGTRLAGLSKDMRKKAKATDPSRVARRLAKKKARSAMEKTGAEGKRVRERERKDKRAKSNLNTGRKDTKKRERSERNLERKNVKK